MENIYPSDFFNIPNPDTPYINIQFRTQIDEGSDPSNPEYWEEITVNPNNFFNNISIEDSGGIQKVELDLNDKNYARIENLVVKTMIASRLANKLVRHEDPRTGDVNKESANYFQFVSDTSTSVNLRIRFGYSSIPTEENFIQDAEVDGENWKSRVNKKIPVIKSPWIYLQILNVKFNLGQEGLGVKISAFSVSSTLLDRAKLLQQFASLKGPPKDILNSLKATVEEVSSNTVTFTFEDEPLSNVDKDGSSDIVISLGSYQAPDPTTGEITPQFKSMREILDDICSKIALKAYDKDGKAIPPTTDTTGEEGDGALQDISTTVKYNYIIKQTDDGKTTIDFKYPDPNTSAQKMARNYIWVEHGQTIVKSLNIESRTDFAMLNLPIAVFSADGEIGLFSSMANKPEEEQGQDQEKDFNWRTEGIKNFSSAMDDPQFSSLFVAETGQADSGLEYSSDSTLNAQRLAAEITHNLNNTVFNGTIELPLDPFYLFDNAVRPFEYLIRIIVKRPVYIDTDLGDSENAIAGGEKSYLSGYYAIKKITHRMGIGGGSTSLEVLRWPMKVE